MANEFKDVLDSDIRAYKDCMMLNLQEISGALLHLISIMRWRTDISEDRKIDPDEIFPPLLQVTERCFKMLGYVSDDELSPADIIRLITTTPTLINQWYPSSKS